MPRIKAQQMVSMANAISIALGADAKDVLLTAGVSEGAIAKAAVEAWRQEGRDRLKGFGMS